MKEKQYDFALSFAGEDRHHAEKLAKLLKARGYAVFYDKNELAHLVGKNLYDRLLSIYKDEARHCVMFLSKHYGQDRWTKHERESAQARAFEEDGEYIIPIRLDNTEIPGILPTVGYLDLSMTPEEICQILVEKLSGTTSQTATTSIPTSAAAESDPSEFALFRTEDGKLYFIPFQNPCWDPTEISLELLPESPEAAAFLRSLRNNLGSIVPIRNTLAFALWEDAAWVSPRKISQATSGSQTVWKVIFEEDSHRQYDNPYGDMTINNISPDQIAEMRARRILLDKKLEAVNPLLNQPNLTYQTTLELSILESSIKGGGSSYHEIDLQIPKSPIPALYQFFGQTAGRFEKFARLISVLYLKLSNTVEDVLQLDLKLLNPKQLQVRFKGRRPQRYTNVEPFTIQVDGICPL